MDNSLSLKGWSDSSFGDDGETRRSTCGYVFTIARGPISVKSRRQSVVALSSTEAEYIALTIAAREVAFLRMLLVELGVNIEAIDIYEDNQPALNIANKPATSAGNTKHVQLRWHYIRQEVQNGHIKLHWIETTQQVADGLTKPLDKIKFRWFKNLLGIVKGPLAKG